MTFSWENVMSFHHGLKKRFLKHSCQFASYCTSIHFSCHSLRFYLVIFKFTARLLCGTSGHSFLPSPAKNSMLVIHRIQSYFFRNFKHWLSHPELCTFFSSLYVRFFQFNLFFFHFFMLFTPLSSKNYDENISKRKINKW